MVYLKKSQSKNGTIMTPYAVMTYHGTPGTTHGSWHHPQQGHLETCNIVPPRAVKNSEITGIQKQKLQSFVLRFFQFGYFQK